METGGWEVEQVSLKYLLQDLHPNTCNTSVRRSEDEEKASGQGEQATERDAKSGWEVEQVSFKYLEEDLHPCTHLHLFDLNTQQRRGEGKRAARTGQGRGCKGWLGSRANGLKYLAKDLYPFL